jgi:hypothetical protein
MPYWVYGSDSESGQPAQPFFTDADNQDAAREQAAAQGIVVESIELHVEDTTSDKPASVLEPDREAGEPGVTGWPPYEFSRGQMSTISSLAFYMGICGAAATLWGGLAMLLGLLAYAPALMVRGVFGLVLGSITCVAAGSFKQIAKTRGEDMEHLMDALSTLKGVYQIQVWLMVIAILFVLIAGFIAICG